jgi:hypothetical protein
MNATASVPVTAAFAPPVVPTKPVAISSPFEFGDIIKCVRSGEYGAVRFVGTCGFAAGTWVGVELDNGASFNLSLYE